MGFNMVKDMNKSVSFGVSYIMTLFASGLSGYYVAKFFGYDETKVYKDYISSGLTLL